MVAVPQTPFTDDVARPVPQCSDARLGTLASSSQGISIPCLPSPQGVITPSAHAAGAGVQHLLQGTRA